MGESPLGPGKDSKSGRRHRYEKSFVVLAFNGAPADPGTMGVVAQMIAKYAHREGLPVARAIGAGYNLEELRADGPKYEAMRKSIEAFLLWTPIEEIEAPGIHVEKLDDLILEDGDDKPFD